MENNEKVEIIDPNVKKVVEIVNNYINTYEVEVTPVYLRFKFLDVDNPELGKNFSKLSSELLLLGYVPQMVKNYEHYIDVFKIKRKEKYSNKANIILLLLTIASTIYAGYEFAQAYVPPGPLAQYIMLGDGAIFFTVPLMTILGIHELGHYFVAKHYNVRASLPYFIPFIPFGFNIGTLGAFISLRDPFPNRKVMTNIGAAGPLAGFITSIPLLFLASYFQKTFVPVNNFIPPYTLQFPLIYQLFHIHMLGKGAIFPMTISVWVGFFATALNLLPMGQLDGGHIARGLLGRKAVYISYMVIFGMLILSYYYFGWIIIALIVLFLGVQHPPALDDDSPVSKLEIVIGILALVLFIISFTPVPFKN